MSDTRPLTRLRFAGYSPSDSVYSRAAQLFKELVESESDGSLRVDLFWNVLDFGYTAEQLIQLVDSGLLFGCYMSTSYLVDLAPRLAALDLPFLVSSRDQVFSALDSSLGSAIAAELAARSGLEVMGYWENGFRHLSNARQQVRTPSDLAGLRIRLQPNELQQRAFRLLGAEPVLTDVADLINALADGRADGQENPLDNIWTYGVYRYTKFVTLTAHLFGVRGMYVNRRWHEKLDSAQQDVLLRAARSATFEQRRLAQGRDAEVRGLLEGQGIEIVDLSAEERAAFREVLRPLYAETAETLGEELLTSISAAS